MRFNLNEISKSAIRKKSQEHEKNECHISNSSPILFKFKEDSLFHELRLDNKNIKEINVHNTTPCYNVPKDNNKTRKVYDDDNQQQNINFEDLRRYSKN